MKKTVLRAFSALLAAIMLLGMTVSAEITYDDTEGHWAEGAIARWTDNGIINGNGTSFDPDAPLTRAMMATVIARMLGLTEQSDAPFADVAPDAWYAPYINACHKAGIMLGDNGKANPDSSVTRQEAMVMLCRALGIEPTEEPDLSKYSDADEVADWALPYVDALTAKGIVGGVSQDLLSPEGTMSRAATVTVIDRAVVQYINEPGSYELTESEGIVLIASDNVTVTGNTPADLLVSPAADNGMVEVKDAEIEGKLTVMADNAHVTLTDSKAEIKELGEGTKVTETETPVEPETPAEPETPVEPAVPSEPIKVHSHKWSSHEWVDENTHKRVCASNSSHVLTDEHSWDEGVEAEGGILLTCKLCLGTKIAEPETPEIPDLMGKNGYDLSITVENDRIYLEPIVPEGDSSPIYEIRFSNNENHFWGISSRFEAPSEMLMLNDRDFDRVYIATLESFDDQPNIVAEWMLEKKLSFRVDAFEASNEGITVTQAPTDMTDRSAFTFSGLDEEYGYVVITPTVRTFVHNGLHMLRNDSVTDGEIKLLAHNTEVTETAYNVTISTPIYVTPEVIGGDIPTPEPEPTPDLSPVGFELTSQHHLLYVSVKEPEVTEGIYTYKVEIYDSDELLAEGEAYPGQPQVNVDPRLLKDGELTVKITAEGRDGVMGEYEGVLEVDMTSADVTVLPTYDNGIFELKFAEDYVGTAYPFFTTDTSDTVGTRLASQLFIEPGNYIGIYSDALEVIESAIESGEDGYVKFTGWTLGELVNGEDKCTLKVTVNESGYTAVDVVIDDPDADYSALGVTVDHDGIFYVFTVINPEFTSKIHGYDVNIYNKSNPQQTITAGVTPNSPKAPFDAENLSKFNPLPDTLEVISYDSSRNEIGRFTCKLELNAEKKDITYAPEYDVTTGVLTVTFPEAISGYMSISYLEKLGESSTDPGSSELDNAAAMVLNKTEEPLSAVADRIETSGGYFQMNGWYSQSEVVEGDTVKLTYTVYYGNYEKITVVTSPDENELPTDPDNEQ